LKGFDWKRFRISLYEIIKNTPLIIREGQKEVFKFECKEIISKVDYDDLEIRAISKNFNFNLTSDDDSLDDEPQNNLKSDRDPSNW